MASQVVTLYKTVSEQIAWTSDFARDLDGDSSLEALESGSFLEAFSTDGTDVEATIIDTQAISGMTITFNIKAGTDGEEYTIRVVAQGATTAEIKEKIIKLVVRDDIPGGV